MYTLHGSPSATRIFAHILLLLSSVLISACDDVIQFTPVEVETNARELTKINVDAIEEKSLPAFAPFKFALISDSHTYHTQFDRAVRAINRRDDLAFLLHAGDMTDWGLLQEYEWALEILQRLTIPYLTTIGNHDAVNNGKDNYKALFGPYDYSFVFNQVKFVVLNDNDWEFDEQAPRLDWLQSQLADFSIYRHQLVLTHVPPDDADRFTPAEISRYIGILKDNFVSLVMYGHNHGHSYREEILTSGDSIGFLTTGAVEKEHYIVVTVDGSGVSFERIAF